MENQVIKQERKVYILNAKDKSLVKYLENVKKDTKTIVYNSYNNCWILPARYNIQVKKLGFHIIENPSTPEKDKITVKVFMTNRYNEKMVVFQCPKMDQEKNNLLEETLHSQHVKDVHYVHVQYSEQALFFLRKHFAIEYSEDAKAFFLTLQAERAEKEKVSRPSNIDWSNIKDFNAILKDFQAKNQTKLFFAGYATSKPHRTIDFSGVGIGKSIQSIAYGLYLRQLGFIKYMIVVVPGILRREFASEIDKFAPELGYEIIEGYKHELDDSKFFKVLSYSLLNDLKRKGNKKLSIAERLLAPIAEKSFIVFDESQKLGNLQAGCTKNAIRLCNGEFTNKKSGKLYKPAVAVRIMTGTPFGTGVSKMWAQLCVLGIEKEISPNFSLFKKTYSIGESIFYKDKKTGKLIERYKETDIRNEEDLSRRLSYCSIRVLIKDVIQDLPTLTRKVINCELPADARRSYDEAEENIIKWIAEKIDGAAAWRASKNEAAIRAGKLNQISANGKVKATADLIKILLENGETFVCFCSYREPLLQLKKLFPELSLAVSGSKKTSIEDFKNGKTKGLLISTAKGNYGLNLQYASRVAIFIDQPPTPDKKTQAEGRVYRTGQNKAVIIYNMLATNTLDLKRCQVIDKRQTSIDRFFGEKKQKLMGKDIIDDTDISNSISMEVLKDRFYELKRSKK